LSVTVEVVVADCGACVSSQILFLTTELDEFSEFQDAVAQTVAKGLTITDDIDKKSSAKLDLATVMAKEREALLKRMPRQPTEDDEYQANNAVIRLPFKPSQKVESQLLAGIAVEVNEDGKAIGPASQRSAVVVN